MIHLPLKDRNAPPARLGCNNALAQLRAVIVHADGSRFTSTYYRDTTVVDLLRALSIHKLVLEPGDQPKCNYCESQVEKGVKLQVEHYRPKAEVDEQDNGGLPHSGYYWLGLEWTNLLLACPLCNGKSAKGTRFPIRGVRATALESVNAQNFLMRAGCFAHEAPLLGEEPLLLNPELDMPEDFLTFDLLGNIHGFGPDAIRGETSKNILNLNRPLLVSFRLSVWDDFKDDILLDISEHLQGGIDDDTLYYSFKKTSKKILKRKAVSEEFTLWGRYINSHIEDFIHADIPADEFYRNFFLQSYHEVLAAINP